VADLLGVDEWADDPSESATAAEPPGYERLLDFVRDELAPLYQRSFEGRTRVWCPQWWRHPEAVARLAAVWQAWEHLRRDPTVGLSVWLRDHADYHVGVLLDPDGPFKGCSPDRGHQDRLASLATDEPPSEATGV
jgi:Domain of unknown function (DUF4913)